MAGSPDSKAGSRGRGRPAGSGGQQSAPGEHDMDRALNRYQAELEGIVPSVESADGGDGVSVAGMPDWAALFIGGTIDRPPRDEIFTGSTDGHGHTSTVKVSIPPYLLGEIDRLIARQVEPQYRSRGDFIRDAITHRMWDVVEGSTGPSERSKDIYKRRMVQDVMDEWWAWVEEGDALVESVAGRLKAAAGRPRFEATLDKMEAYALGMAPPWRGQVLDIIAGYRAQEQD